MKISASDLCNHCANMMPRMKNGGIGPEIKNFLDSRQYDNDVNYGNLMILNVLEGNSSAYGDRGCSKCIDLVKSAIQS